MRFCGIIFFLAVSLFAWGNTGGERGRREAAPPAVAWRMDSLPTYALPEVEVAARARGKRHQARVARRNARLERNVRAALPYAREAARVLVRLDSLLGEARGEGERRRIVREEYRRLTRTFKKPLTRLTVSQGKILVRLVYRETSNSAFEHIREYKGAVSACFWQGIALLFGNNLKADYEPEGRDREIEEIVRKVDSERK